MPLAAFDYELPEDGGLGHSLVRGRHSTICATLYSLQSPHGCPDLILRKESEQARQGRLLPARLESRFSCLLDQAQGLFVEWRESEKGEMGGEGETLSHSVE